MRTTLNIDDQLVRRAKIVAIETHRTLSAMVESGLREILDCSSEAPSPSLGSDPYGNGLPFPTWDGGGFPEGFDTSSTSAMIEFLEKLEAADGDA